MNTHEHIWQFQEAKNKLSAVLDKTLSEGPQAISRHGKRVAVILDAETYDRLSSKKTEEDNKGFIDLLMSCPVDLSELDLSRPQGPARELPDLFTLDEEIETNK